MNHRLRDYFTFTQSEQNGIVVLLGIIILLIGGIHATKYIAKKSKIDFSKFESEITAFEEQIVIESESHPKKLQSNVVLSKFNPNNLNAKQWEKMGLKPWVAERIKNYVAKGGSFRKKEDLKKIYGFTETDYNRLKDYIVIPKVEVTQLVNDHIKEAEEIDINTANEDELELAVGIGPTFAGRIVKYRKLLGGFVNKEQLKEVYGINDTIYTRIRKQLTFKSTTLKKININTIDARGLLKHPYIEDWNLAKVIVRYREQHGPYVDIKELKQIHLFNDSLYNKLSPYLTIK